MLEWLKTILGAAYTDDIDKKVSDEIGKGFVARTDFNTQGEKVKTLEGQITARDKQIEDLKKLDPEGLQAKIAELETKNADEAKQRQADADKYAADIAKRDFDVLLDSAIAGAKAKDIKSVKAHLDIEKLMQSKDQSTDIKTELEKVQKEKAFLFGDVQTPPNAAPIVPGLGDQTGGAGGTAAAQQFAEALDGIL